jgi:hypothetical protein
VAYQTLKYGTRVLVGLAVTGATIYTVTRLQVKPVDFIEIMEGVRERQMIVSAITQTNVFGLQIASNRANLVQLDADIDTLIPNFVNQHSIAAWLADRPDTNPVPMWTKTSLLTYLGVGNGTNFTRTPAPATTNNVATFGAWPIQIYATDLKERYAVLQKLTYTTTAASWHSNLIYAAGSGGYAYYETNQTNIGHGDLWNTCDSHTGMVVALDAAKPEWFLASDTNTYTVTSPAPPGSPTATATGLAPTHTNYAKVSTTQYQADYIGWSISPWTFRYQVTKIINQVLDVRKVESSMKSTAPSNCLTRIDYYYADNASFEVINVSSNTPTTYTTNFVAAPVATQSTAQITVSYDIAPLTNGYTIDCTSDSLLKIIKSPTNAINASDSDGVTVTKGIVPVIHEWGVTRCVPP